MAIIDFKKYKQSFLKDFNVNDIAQFPAGICITIVDKCNLKCKFCPYGNGYIYSGEPIKLNIIEKICNDIGSGYSGYISLGEFGEPTLNKDLSMIVSIIAQKCQSAKIVIITNGTNISLISNLPFFKNLIIQVSKYREFNENEIMLLDKSQNKIQIRDINYDYIQKNFNNRAGNVQWLVNPVLNQCCNLPFYKMSIDQNGNVLQCCGDWKRENILGNVKESSISMIWNNNSYYKIRKALLEDNRIYICSRCNCNGNRFGEQFVRQWRSIYGC